jgi:hypothetical protein
MEGDWDPFLGEESGTEQKDDSKNAWTSLMHSFSEKHTSLDLE